jgi:WD40 repeat protein
MRLGTIHLRHLRHRGIAVAFSKDGKHLISCGSYEVRVWDAATGRLVRRTRLAWKGSEGDWHARVSLTPDGTTAAVWDWGGLTRCLYDTSTGQERGRLPNNAVVTAFSPDSKWMVVDRQDREGKGPVQLWDIVEVKNILTLDVPPGTILNAAAFTPDGKQLAALGDMGKELLVWDAFTGKLKQRKKLATPMMSLAYATDAATLVLGRSGRAEAVLFDVATWKETVVLPARANVKDGGYIVSVGFSPDGRMLAGSYADYPVPGGFQEHGFLIWDLSKPARPRRLLSGSQIGAFAFAPDGKTLAYRDSNSDVIDLWDVASGRRLPLPPGHETLVAKLAVSPDGKILASGDYKPTLRLWDTGTGRLLRSLDGRENVASPWLYSADGQRMISVSGEKQFQLWEVATGKELRHFGMDLPLRFAVAWATVETVGLSGDGKRLAAVVSVASHISSAPDTLPQLFLWDITTGKQLTRRPLMMRVWNNGSAAQKMSYRWRALLAPDGGSIVEWRGDRLTIEDISTKCLLAELPNDVGDPQAFSADGRLLAAVSLQPKKERPGYDVKGLSLIETASGQEVVRLQISKFDHVAFTPDSRAVVVEDKKELSVWDTATGERLHRMEWPESIRDERGDAKLSSLVVLPGGRVATGTAEGDILVWDLAPSTWPLPRPPRELSREQFNALWSDLARDARTAYRAVSLLAAALEWSVPLLGTHLHPVAVDRKRIEKLMADLDDDSFQTREQATRELLGLRYRVEPMLRRALENKPSLEMRRRLEAILAEPKRPSPADLRMLRAIAVLERIATPEARRILEKLADREAQAALQRLKYR